MSPGTGSSIPDQEGGLSRRAFLRARAYMEAHIGEPLRLCDIARAAHLSRSHFARAFRISTGLSVMTYLRRLRIEKAKAQLIGSEASIAEVSAMLGFAHHSHFTRLFRREVGMTPRLFAHLYGVPPAETDGAPP
jgi:AraC family transcriptional regulator